MSQPPSSHLPNLQGQSPLFVKTYDMLVWLSGRVSGFPKAHRFRLAKRIEDAAFGFHECLLRVTRTGRKRDKLRLLLDADIELDKLRFYVRMAAHNDLRLITMRQYEHASKLLAEIGRLLGGWIKTVQKGEE